jgi:LPXTG-motif cell wall-anchored protein
VEFKASVDKAAVTVGDSITLTLTLSSEPQIALRIPEAGPQITGLRIVDAGEEGPKPVDNRIVQKKWYRLQADMTGSYIIPALSVTYTDAAGVQQELKTAQLFLDVQPAPKDSSTGAAAELRDIKPPEEVPWRPGKLLIYGAVAGFLLIAGAGFFYFRRKKKTFLQEPPLPPHVRAFEELEQLAREQLIERGIVREYYFRLSEIFRRYIERRFHIPAVERTTEEIMPDIVRLQECNPAVKAETQDILRYADLVKFARFQPDWNTSTQDYQKVVQVIEATKQAPPAETSDQTGAATQQGRVC